MAKDNAQRKYIDVDKFAEKICNFQQIDEDTVNKMIFLLRTFPTADVEEVKHGEWVSDTHNPYRKFCSVCARSRPRRNDHEFASSTNYCPHCGAKMDGGKAE